MRPGAHECGEELRKRLDRVCFEDRDIHSAVSKLIDDAVVWLYFCLCNRAIQTLDARKAIHVTVHFEVSELGVIAFPPVRRGGERRTEWKRERVPTGLQQQSLGGVARPPRQTENSASIVPPAITD